MEINICNERGEKVISMKGLDETLYYMYGDARYKIDPNDRKIISVYFMANNIKESNIEGYNRIVNMISEKSIPLHLAVMLIDSLDDFTLKEEETEKFFDYIFLDCTSSENKTDDLQLIKVFIERGKVDKIRKYIFNSLLKVNSYTNIDKYLQILYEIIGVELSFKYSEIFKKYFEKEIDIYTLFSWINLSKSSYIYNIENDIIDNDFITSDERQGLLLDILKKVPYEKYMSNGKSYGFNCVVQEYFMLDDITNALKLLSDYDRIKLKNSFGEIELLYLIYEREAILGNESVILSEQIRSFLFCTYIFKDITNYSEIFTTYLRYSDKANDFEINHLLKDFASRCIQENFYLLDKHMKNITKWLFKLERSKANKIIKECQLYFINVEEFYKLIINPVKFLKGVVDMFKNRDSYNEIYENQIIEVLRRFNINPLKFIRICENAGINPKKVADILKASGIIPANAS
ncbi:hypothetical protein [Clostridium sp.]|uniref:hypothetical protein n=1 Tax=Clostridium sp. TaxID=1506 RepID=UPI001B6ECA5E|nr:hypothetical protein [Clostridium sp.]MBP3916597.1 hypothetical protein [Clostridium sp.]